MPLFDESTTANIDDDRRVIASLHSAGADLSKPRRVWHYLYFDDATSAGMAAKALQKEGDHQGRPYK